MAQNGEARMRTSVISAAGILAVCIPLGLWAAEVEDGSRKKLQGSYTIYSLDLGDTLPPTLKDAKLNMSIEDSMARKIYSYMGKSSEIRDACSDKTIRQKGDLTCLMDGPGQYRCGIGINLKTGKSINGMIC
jgi:hypothetical protein